MHRIAVYTSLILTLLVAACGSPGGAQQAPAGSTPAVASPTQAQPTAAAAVVATQPAAATTAPQAAATGSTAGGAQTQPTTAAPPRTGNQSELILATTTSTQDSGLLDYILPDFNKKYNAKVDVVAVGTGQAIEIGNRGDADVLLVHARAQEDRFVASGNGIDRRDVMHNDFIVVGPKDDPAGIKGMTSAVDAFKKIADAKAKFASRGDKSGTDTKEKSIWATARITPTKESGWYLSLGQGMGETLTTSNEAGAYTLTDRATWLAQKSHLTQLDVMLGGQTIEENKDKTLLNPYGVILVNPAKFPAVNAALARQFEDWLVLPDTQKMIGSYGVDKFGQQLFIPDAK